MRRIVTVLIVCAAFPALSATIHVAADSPSGGPGTAWSNAFRTIQAGVNAALVGDRVLVTNGVYDAGGLAAPGHTLINRVCITNDITLESVNE